MTEPFEVTIEEREAGDRLDKVLAARDLGLSRATLQRWIEEGRVTHDGRPISAKEKARAGLTLRIEPAPPPPSDALPENIPLTILFEDD